MSFSPSSNAQKKKWLLPVIGAVVVAVIAAGGFIWWFLRDDAPDAVSLATATESLSSVSTASTAAAAGSSDTTAAGAATSAAASSGGDASTTTAATSSGSAIAGIWNVDTSIGEFSFENSTGSFVGFRVDEELQGVGSTTAVGRTPNVSGTMTIDGTTVTAVSIEADMTALVTNESRRDSRARGALETDQFPTATFVLTQPIELGAEAADGAPTSVTATGDLTIRGVTKSVQFPLEAQLTNGLVVVVGSLNIVFADYGVSVPTAPFVLSAEDNGPIELQLFFAKG